MKKLYVIIAVLCLFNTSIFSQCSVNQTINYLGNGVVQVNVNGHVPAGANPSMDINFADWINSYASFNDTIGSGQHTYVSNGVYIIRSYLYNFDSLGNQLCGAVSDSDTLIVDDLPCFMELQNISYHNSGNDYTINCFPNPNSTGSLNGSIQMNFQIFDSTGVEISNQSGGAQIWYTFNQFGTYKVVATAVVNDTIGHTTCSDTSVAYIHHYPYNSCGISLMLQSQNLTGNSVFFTAFHSNGYFSTSYFKIEGNYYYGNSDTITHTFSAPGTYQVCFYGENPNNGVVCRDSICLPIQVGFGPGNCHALFNMWEDSSIPEHWLASNNSIVYGSPGFTWDFGDGVISHLPYPSHYYNTPGNYVICLTVTDNYGGSNTRCDSSAAFRLTEQYSVNSTIASINVLAPQVGLQENSMLLHYIHLYPNPMADQSYVSFNSTLAVKGKLEVVGVLGNVLVSQEISIAKGSNEIGLNTANLTNGVYYVNIVADGGIITTVKAVK